MPNFVKTTGLVQTASLTTRLPITPTRVATLPNYQPDVTTAMGVWQSLGGTPPSDTSLYGAFELQWAQTDLRVYIVCGTPMVTVVDDLLVIDFDLWETKAQHDTLQPALIRETLIHQVAQTLADIQKTMFDYLVTATVQGFSGDQREPRANVTIDPAFDALHHWLSKPFVIGLNGRILQLV